MEVYDFTKIKKEIDKKNKGVTPEEIIEEISQRMKKEDRSKITSMVVITQDEDNDMEWHTTQIDPILLIGFLNFIMMSVYSTEFEFLQGCCDD